MSEPRQFILQARDPDHGSPVFEARFPVAELDDLRALIGADADDDPAIEHSYMLDAADTAAVTTRFGVAFDPEGCEVHLWPWTETWGSIRHIPYMIHGGYELPLLLEGRKQLADMSYAYPPHQHFHEDKFDRYVAEVFSTKRCSMNLSTIAWSRIASRTLGLWRACAESTTRARVRNGVSRPID
jgi:hypothetical protein